MTAPLVIDVAEKRRGLMNSTKNQTQDALIRVRTKDVIAIHWFNALCWLVLVPTGFGIISGDFVRLAPQFWPHFMQNLFHYERFRRCGCVFGR